MNPHPGIWDEPANVPGYCHASPNGDNNDGSRATANYSLLTANSLTFTFSAKEKDSETGLSYFGSRYYSSDLSVWLSVDPMSDKYPSLSPYVYCADNPVKLVDPDGKEVPPIYDTHGNFLGTDDEGLTGKAIVMKKENFKQGMSHADALSYNLGKKGLVDEIAFNKLSDHFAQQTKDAVCI